VVENGEEILRDGGLSTCFFENL